MPTTTSAFRKRSTTTVHAAVLTDGSAPAIPDSDRAAPGGAVQKRLVPWVGDTVEDGARFIRSVVPGRLPLYLGVTALVVVGAIEAPAAVAGGLVYEALRRWAPPRAGQTAPRTTPG